MNGDDAYEGDIVTVAHRFGPIEAQLLRGRLVADGIPATLGDAHTVQTDTLLTAALGGVRVMVPAAYEERARRAIAAVEGGAFMLDDSHPVGPADDPPNAPGGPSRSLPPLTLVAAAGLVVAAVLAAFGG